MSGLSDPEFVEIFEKISAKILDFTISSIAVVMVFLYFFEVLAFLTMIKNVTQFCYYYFIFYLLFYFFYYVYFIKTSSAYIVLIQKRCKYLIDLLLFGIYNRIHSKIMFESVSEAESVILSKNLLFP